MRHVKMTLAAVASCLALAGCESGVSADAPYFDGLPKSVVSEFLSLPGAQRNMKGLPGNTLHSLAQAGVRNMIFCRKEFHAYLHWLSTGSPPAVVPGPVPAHPLEPGNAAIASDYATFRAVLRSGQLGRLRFDLIANGSCGQWVPAAPGTRRPTIARLIRAERR